MNRLFRLKTWGLSLCLVAGLVSCKVGDTETTETDTKSTESPATPGPDAAATAPPVELRAEGELSSVDVEGMTFTLKDASGAERKFSFSSSTRITGVPDAQGLAAKKGSRVTTGYTTQADTNTAVWIEIAAKPVPVGMKARRLMNA
jgi:hypothetical protein